jgi:hypothetical protein
VNVKEKFVVPIRNEGRRGEESLKYIPDKMGVARVVRLRAADGEMTHPMQHHCHMEVPGGTNENGLRL